MLRLLLNPTMVDIMEDMEAMVDTDIDMARGVLMLRLLLNPTMVDIMEDMEAMVDMDIDMARGVLMLGLLLNPTMVDIMGIWWLWRIRIWMGKIAPKTLT